MVVKFNFRGKMNTLAGHKRNLANTKKRDEAVRKIQVAYRAALERRRKRAAAATPVTVKKPKTAVAKPKVKAKKPKPKKKKLVKSKVRALLKLNRPALEKKFQDTRKLARELACGNRNFLLRDRRFGPKEIKKLGLMNRELVDMIRRTEQSCFNATGFSRIPTKQERKYFAGANMSNNAKTNKNYVPNNYNSNSNSNHEYEYNNYNNYTAMNAATTRAYLRNQIINRFGVDPNKNERFIRWDNWRNYSNDPNDAKVLQYASTLRQPGKLAGKKSRKKNWMGPAVPTTEVGHRKMLAQRSGPIQRFLASQILEDLSHALNGNNINWARNLSENDKTYAKRLINTHGPYSNKLMTSAVANNIIKRFGKRKSRAARKDINKKRANNFRTLIANFRPHGNVNKNKWLKGMGMNNEFLKKIGVRN